MTICWFGTNTDVTEQLAAEENLRIAKEAAETANTAKDNFLATLSHELRTPLTPALATLGVWENNEQFPADLRDDLTMIRRNIDLEARLIDDLLDITRIINGKIALNIEVLDVQDLLRSVVGMYQSEINTKQIELSIRPMADRCHVRADPGRLQQAFWNLLKNAVQFTPQGGRIQVSTRNDQQGRIQITIEDNGIGMSEELIGRLFTPFAQETAGRYGGLGLGLAITKTLLNVQGGEIEANSEGPFRGARFTIRLPCVDALNSDQLGAATRSASASGEFEDEARSCRILLVEDHVDTAQVLARLLQRNGHDVIVASTVAEALSIVRNRTFDILLSDIGLPDGTGVDLIRQIRQQYSVDLPAVAMTGFGMDDDIARCMEAGFNHHLTKRVNLVRLEKTVQHACKSSNGDK